MKKDYQKPTIEVILFNDHEIMTVSGEVDFNDLE